MVLPFTFTPPTPLTLIVVPQQTRYSPVTVLIRSLLLESVSSCKQTLKTHTWKLHIAVLPDVSVAVQVTVVHPVGNVPPEAGVQTTAAGGRADPGVGQLSVAVAGG